MRLRAYVAAASIAAGLWLSAGNARAQGPAPPPSAPAQAPDIVGIERFFSAPSALGDTWARVVHAALDGVRDLLQTDGATARAALAPTPKPKPRAPAWQTVVPPREAPKARPVAFQPVSVEPVTRTVADDRGQSATLLGVRAALPWNVP